MDLVSLKHWFWTLGAQYGVDPVIYGILYVGSIPFSWLSVAWLVRNIRQRRPILVPATLTVLFFLSAYLYVVIAGRNVPFWVYAGMSLLLFAGGISSMRTIRARINPTPTPSTAR